MSQSPNSEERTIYLKNFNWPHKSFSHPWEMFTPRKDKRHSSNFQLEVKMVEDQRGGWDQHLSGLCTCIFNFGFLHASVDRVFVVVVVLMLFVCLANEHMTWNNLLEKSVYHFITIDSVYTFICTYLFWLQGTWCFGSVFLVIPKNRKE